MSNSSPSVGYPEIQAAATRLAGVAHTTPVLTSRLVNEQTQAEVFFKAENLQRTGSFKFRGAYNAIAQLAPEQKAAGVVTYSSGNHAQAVALAGQLLDVKTTIVMPEDAPAVKLDATRGYGAQVLLYDRAEESREQVAQRVCTDQGAVLIPPYNHPQIIAGQGTVAKELHEAVPDLDLLLVCCGGGGLLSGCGLATHAIAPNCRVIGVEPQAGDDATRSFYSKTLQTITNPQTIADGARTASLGSLTFPLVLDYVNAMATVSDRQLLKTLLFLMERLKVVVEPTGALAASALLEAVVIAPRQRVGVVLSGGNVDLPQLLRTKSHLLH